MNSRKPQRGFRPLADMASGVLDPVLRKRAGINLALIQSWEDIVGGGIGAQSRPLKILWPRRTNENDPFQPATLVIACEGFTAMRVQHETGEIISRVNAFLGFAAIGRIKIEQKPATSPAPSRNRSLPDLGVEEQRRIDEVTSGIEDDGLRAALARLGRSISASKMPVR